MSADSDKAGLRSEARAKRAEAFRQHGAAAAQNLARHVLAVVENLPASMVAGYWAVGSEIDVAPVMERLTDEGWNVALPIVVEDAAPLIFRRWLPGDVLVEGPFKTLHPQPGCEEFVPEIILTPLLAFDDQRYRLGQGGGFYDRTLEKLKKQGDGVVSIGVAFAAQQVASVPRDVHDQQLDYIVTDKGKL